MFRKNHTWNKKINSGRYWYCCQLKSKEFEKRHPAIEEYYLLRPALRLKNILIVFCRASLFLFTPFGTISLDVELFASCTSMRVTKKNYD